MFGTIMWKTRRWRARLEKTADNMVEEAGQEMETSLEKSMVKLTDAQQQVVSRLLELEHVVEARVLGSEHSSSPNRAASAASLISSALGPEVELLRKDMTALREDLARASSTTSTFVAMAAPVPTASGSFHTHDYQEDSPHQEIPPVQQSRHKAQL
eukprot:gnl/TRDRNA2_/TRDRNA2_161161_c1_seq1.p1 gnl/TRDRNA2_/TRDRNA2_161161_c1~~gnl/TRDRNA2_/TRDRNA2_161161_c1_seq1.p1  ORF type:complete len:156 (+),score=21.76 gnl/TRDRNA2_/TRDRNA2_161161_c1_seq1:54-521(+)